MRVIVAAAVLALAGCATASAPQPINSAASAPTFVMAPQDIGGDVVIVSLSGGGARAAAFSLGALQGLRDMHATDGRTLLDHVRVVTSASGGSIMAAYFGQRGPAGLDTFRAAYLDKNWQIELHTSPFWPVNWFRVSRGALNDRTLLADWLNREVFDGGRLNAVWGGQNNVQVWINATDLYNGTTFAFAPPYFDALCSDLGSVRIADAVAASMAVPVYFQPVLVQPYPDHCAPLPDWAAHPAQDASALMRRTAEAFASYRDPARQPYLHLVDGGVVDNLGLTSLSLQREVSMTPYGPLSERDAVRLRRLTVLVVNAEQARDATWQSTARGPNGAQTVERLAGIVIESPNRSSYDIFRLLLADWERDLRTYRCGLSGDDVLRLRGSLDGWDCNDVHVTISMMSFADFDAAEQTRLSHAPTAVSLPHATIDDLIDAGRRGMQANAAAQALTH